MLVQGGGGGVTGGTKGGAVGGIVGGLHIIGLYPGQLGLLQLLFWQAHIVAL